jgi:multidrug efflux pump subunit AcrB
MVLFSLVLALGMLVDNGIVVVENIYRLMDEGKSSFEAAKQGVGEVAWPIIASTATTLAAFLPLAIWPGLIGEFMKYLPITLMIVLSSSLFVALVINPVLTAAFMRVGDDGVSKKRAHRVSISLAVFGVVFLALRATAFGNILLIAGLLTISNAYVLNPGTRLFQSRFLPRLERGYEQFLRYVLSGRRPWAFFFGTAGLMVLAFVLLGTFPPKVEFFPSNEPQYLNIFISKPIGTDIEETNRVTREIEELVLAVMNEERFKRPNPETGELEAYIANSIIAQVGNGTSDPQEGPSLGNTPHKARVVVNFVKFQERRGQSSREVLRSVRERLSGYPDAEIIVTKNSDGPPQGPPINIEILGDDYDDVLITANSMRQFLRELDFKGVEELKIDVDKRKPELPITIDREKARLYGLSTQNIGYTIRTALFGREVSTFKDGEDDYPINVRFEESSRNNVDALMNQKVIFRSASDGQIKEVPISAVATADRSTTFSSVKRKDLDRVITLSSNVLEGANANEIVLQMQESLKSFNAPRGVQFAFTGQQEEQAKELAFCPARCCWLFS